jgi:hypothetical protein
MIDDFGRMTTGEPVFLRNLTLYPVRLASSNGGAVVSVDEVLDSDLGEFRELKTPRVDEIEFENRGDKPVLMLDGEEITGSLQNRIVAASTYVEPHMAANIGVICAEEDRWEELGAFTTGYCSYPGIRAILLGRGRRKDGLQQSVWDEIERKMTVTRTLSATSSMHDIYSNLDDEISRYVEDFAGLNHDTVGFIGVAGGKILGLDIFAGPAIYRKYEGKLLRSYALDAIEHRRAETVRANAARFFEKVRQGLTGKRFSRRSRHFTLKDRGFSGQGIHDRTRIMHLSAFPG